MKISPNSGEVVKALFYSPNFLSINLKSKCTKRKLQSMKRKKSGDGGGRENIAFCF